MYEYNIFLCVLLLPLTHIVFGKEIGDSNNIKAPKIQDLTAYNTRIEVSWTKVESDSSDPVIGYKVKVWEITDKTIYIFENGQESQVLVQETRPAEPFADLIGNSQDNKRGKPTRVIIKGPNESSAKIENIGVNVTYEVRVQAFTKTAEGPLSDPSSVKLYDDDDQAAGKSRNDISIATN